MSIDKWQDATAHANSLLRFVRPCQATLDSSGVSIAPALLTVLPDASTAIEGTKGHASRTEGLSAHKTVPRRHGDHSAVVAAEETTDQVSTFPELSPSSLRTMHASPPPGTPSQVSPSKKNVADHCSVPGASILNRNFLSGLKTGTSHPTCMVKL